MMDAPQVLEGGGGGVSLSLSIHTNLFTDSATLKENLSKKGGKITVQARLSVQCAPESLGYSNPTPWRVNNPQKMYVANANQHEDLSCLMAVRNTGVPPH